MLCRRKTAAPQGACERIDPTNEIDADSRREFIARDVEREGANEANSLTGAKISGDLIPHFRDCRAWLAMFERFIDITHEPVIDISEDRRRHFLFAAGEKMIEAAFAESGALSNPAESRALIAKLAKCLGKQRHDVGFLENGAGHQPDCICLYRLDICVPAGGRKQGGPHSAGLPEILAQAAGRRDDVAGNPRRLLGCEEDRNLGDIVWLADTA